MRENPRSARVDKTVAVRLSDETYARIREIANEEEMRVSDVVRRLIRQSLAKEAVSS